MALSSDATSAAVNSTLGAGSLSWSHTCNASASVLYAGFMNTTNRHATGVTYNSVAMSSVTSITNGSTNCTELWSLLAPTAGANTISVTFSASARAAGGGISFIGGDATTPTGSSTKTTGTTNDLRVKSVSDTVGDIVLYAGGWAASDADRITGSTLGTSKVSVGQTGAGGNNDALFGMATLAATGSDDLDMTLGNSIGGAAIGGAVKAAAGGGGGGSTGTGSFFYFRRRRYT